MIRLAKVYDIQEIPIEFYVTKFTGSIHDHVEIDKINIQDILEAIGGAPFGYYGLTIDMEERYFSIYVYNN